MEEIDDLPRERNIRFQQRQLFIEKLLGEGGFANVYQVRDVHSGELFALKKINVTNMARENLAQIKSEVNLWREVSGQRNIVTIHAVQQLGDDLYILQDLCQGGTLFDLLMKFDGKLQEGQILHILKDICTGLQHMHER